MSKKGEKPGSKKVGRKIDAAWQEVNVSDGMPSCKHCASPISLKIERDRIHLD
jgi:hypothetical protein